MNILGYFSSSGVPQTSLSPTIRIRRIDTHTLVVTDAPTINDGDGFYIYNFAPLGGVDYSVRMDGGSGLAASDRYLAGGFSGTAMLSSLDATAVMLATADVRQPLCPVHKVGNVGTVFRFRVYDHARQVVDIGAATTLEITFKSGPKATPFVRTAVLTTDGSDGDFEYATIAGDLSVANPCWQAEGKVVVPGLGTFHTETIHFEVKETIHP